MMQRWNQHVLNANSRPKGRRSHLWGAIRKYGPQAFSHEVLEVCETLESANEAEAKWIDHFDSRNPEKGFNLMKGGKHIPHPKKNPWDRPEFRRKMEETVIPKFIAASMSPKTILAMKESFARPESKKKRSKSSSLMWESDEYRDRHAEFWKDMGFRNKCQSGLVHGASLNREKTHCKNGHEYTEENTRINCNGSRVCKICERISGKRSKRIKRAEKRYTQTSLNG